MRTRRDQNQDQPDETGSWPDYRPVLISAPAAASCLNAGIEWTRTEAREQETVRDIKSVFNRLLLRVCFPDTWPRISSSAARTSILAAPSGDPRRSPSPLPCCFLSAGSRLTQTHALRPSSFSSPECGARGTELVSSNSITPEQPLEAAPARENAEESTKSGRSFQRACRCFRVPAPAKTTHGFRTMCASSNNASLALSFTNRWSTAITTSATPSVHDVDSVLYHTYSS